MENTPAHTPLDYAPVSRAPSKSQRLAVASMWLGFGGLAWGFIVSIVAGLARMGQTKSILLDGSIDLARAAPSVLAVIFGVMAIYGWRRSRRIERDLTLSVIGIVFGAGWIIYVATFFVNEVLLSPQRHWDSI